MRCREGVSQQVGGLGAERIGSAGFGERARVREIFYFFDLPAEAGSAITINSKIHAILL